MRAIVALVVGGGGDRGAHHALFIHQSVRVCGYDEYDTEADGSSKMFMQWTEIPSWWGTLVRWHHQWCIIPYNSLTYSELFKLIQHSIMRLSFCKW